ncbi:MAG: cell filamentation protein Fic [Gammaproteobacteria bacterium RIFCSPHIGHO2_12_FULL_41_20]|nr:MAG: cell filamentation protein Fic [Gammaproteobacteria bacterium RIFCSPHIGHO2_12_FULL_41_20]
MEPLLIPENAPNRTDLMDLVLDLTQKSAQFKNSLPSAIQNSLAGTVRAMNCYYSNLIEGHNTHPIAIEQALNGNYDSDPKKRNLQLEAKAHIEVQEWIDNGGITNSIFAPKTICEIHRRFCEKLPEELLWVEDLKTNKKIRVVPGKPRKNDVQVGGHIAISPGAVPRFLQRYEKAYSPLGKSETMLALAAAHHRFLWIHPFLDGNGRVARFISYTTILNTLDTGGTWSVARGLARNVNEYKQLLMSCDSTRRNDLDGRGNLSQEFLIAFTKFFLEVCIDQVAFMQELMEPDKLRTRVLLWAKEEIEIKNIPQQSFQILEKILYRGEITRGEIPDILNLTERQTRRITSSLVDLGILTSDSPKATFRLVFSAKLAHRWMPGLFPEK